MDRTIRSTSGRSLSMAKLDAKYSVFREGFEGITQPLYDYVTYAQAGQVNLLLFQVPQGQGGKTLADTNMTLAGQIPANQKQLIDGIRVDYQSAADASRTGAIVATNWNDMMNVLDAGSLQLTIGQKPYFQGANLKMFPPCWKLEGGAALADTTTAAGARVTVIDAPFACGDQCKINPVMLPPNETFGVALNWNAVVAVSAATRIGVHLDGINFRRSQ